MSHIGIAVAIVLACSLFICGTTAQTNMIICDYDIIVHRWIAFSTNSSFLDHDNATVKMHCNRLRDLYRDPEFEKEEWSEGEHDEYDGGDEYEEDEEYEGEEEEYDDEATMEEEEGDEGSSNTTIEL